MLFGDQQYQNLPEDVIEILVDGGLGAANWERMRYIDRQVNALRANRAGYTGWRQFFKTLGVSTLAIKAAWMAWNNENKERHEGLGKRKARNNEDNQRGNKIQANEHNIKKAGEVPMIEAEKVGEKRQAPVIDVVAPQPKAPKSGPKPDTSAPRGFLDWYDTTLQDRDLDWLHGNEEEIDVEMGEIDNLINETDDLIRGFDGSGTSGSGSGSGSNMDESMEPAPEAAQARQSNAVGAGNVSKETPVTNAQPTYALQETHTTLLPFNCFFSVVNPAADYSTAATTYQSFRMTSPLACIVNSLGTVAEGAAWTAAPGNILNVPFNNAATRSAAGKASVFPYTTPAGSSATEKAWWFAYWAKIYEYYTVLNCEYEIVVANPTTTNSQGMVIGIDFDAYSDTAGATGNITPKTASLMEMRSFKNIKWRRVGPNSPETNYSPNVIVIRGNYKPGMAHRNISNDGDVKTWNKINAQPTLKEFMNLYFYRDPLSYIDNDSNMGVNVSVKLMYTVQFKDLQQQARYPCASLTDISQVIDTDVAQVL